MFRDNEASRVGAVLERKAAGDRAGMIAAAAELWVREPEREGEAWDGAAAEVWEAIASARAVAEALAAAFALFATGVRIRPHAFVDLTEAMDVAQLDRALELVLAAGWPPHPYLAAVLFRYAETEHDDVLHERIQRHAAALRADTARWTCTGFVLATTGAGNRADVDVWFADWRAHAGVPMWIMATYAGSLARLPSDSTRTLAALAAEVYTATTWDVTTGYFVPLLAVDALLRGARDEFLSRVRATTAIGGAAPPPDPLANPLVAYANAAKHARQITRADLAWHPDAVSKIVDNMIIHPSPTAPRDWRLVMIVHALDDLIARGDRILPVFAQMTELRRGDPRAQKLYRDMQRAHLSDWPPLEPIWKRLARERVTPWQRFKLEFFD